MLDLSVVLRIVTGLFVFRGRNALSGPMKNVFSVGVLGIRATSVPRVVGGNALRGKTGEIRCVVRDKSLFLRFPGRYFVDV